MTASYRWFNEVIERGGEGEVFGGRDDDGWVDGGWWMARSEFQGRNSWRNERHKKRTGEAKNDNNGGGEKDERDARRPAINQSGSEKK